MHSIWQSYPAWCELAPHAAVFDCDVLNALRQRFVPDLPAHFAPQAILGSRRRRAEAKSREKLSYEEEILAHGRIPTRPTHPHDLYNALVWFTFPQAKWALHTLSHALQNESADSSRRGLHHQRLAGLDEGGLLLIVRQGERERAHKLINQGTAEEKAGALSTLHHELFVFGHGLMEVLMAETGKRITAFTLVVDVPDDFFEQPYTQRLAGADARLAAVLAKEGADPHRIGSLPAWLL